MMVSSSCNIWRPMGGPQRIMNNNECGTSTTFAWSNWGKSQQFYSSSRYSSQVTRSRSEIGPTEWWCSCWFLQYARYCCGLRQGCYIYEHKYRVSFVRKRMTRAYLCGRERALTLLTTGSVWPHSVFMQCLKFLESAALFRYSVHFCDIRTIV